MSALIQIQSNPTVMSWHGIYIIKVSEIPGDFAEWLNGQTLPYPQEDEHPSDWAYYSDYSRWIQKLDVID